jgi:hypothetical protein
MAEWVIIEDEEMKREWLKWGNIADIWDEVMERCEKVAEKLYLEFTEFSDAKTFYLGPYYYERHYAYFKKKDSDNEVRVLVVEIVADSKVSEVIEIRTATEDYIEEQLKEILES